LIISALKGGLGNQLFQFAAGKSLSLYYKVDHELDTSYFDRLENKIAQRNLDIYDFKISSKIVSDINFAKLRQKGLKNVASRINNKIFKRYYLNWDPKFFSNKSSYLDGYFQSEKYFLWCDHEIRNELILRDELLAEITNIKDEINQTHNAVSLHIRRGDYVINPKNRHLYDICSGDYYNKAIKYIKDRVQNPTFFIFSDEINIFKDILKSNERFIPISSFLTKNNEKLKPSQELFLMSLCKNHIIANSSFSWWGAYLNANNNKTVIAPNLWNRSKFYRQTDIVPKNWIKLETQ
jgi:hypothetical protein